MIANFECQECGSSQIAESDGFFVCRGCGLTVEGPVIQYNIGGFKTDKNGNAFQTHALLLNGTQIGNDSERKIKHSHINFARLQKINRSLSKDEKIEARVLFNTLIAKFGIAADIKLFMDSFFKIFPKIKKHTKSRNTHLFCTTIYYVVMSQQLKNISLKTLLAEQNIDHREFFICVKAIFNELPDLFKEKAETMKMMIHQNISKACQDLRLSSEVRRIAIKIARNFEGRLGFKSRVIAASAVSIALRILSLEKVASILQISESLEITASTVYSHIKNVKINILKQKYQEYLSHLDNTMHVVIPEETIQEKTKKLHAEPIIEEPRPLIAIKTQVPILVISNHHISKKIKKRRTSEFITKNKSIFSKFTQPSRYLDVFRIPAIEKTFKGISPSLEVPPQPVIFSEFAFSPPIS
nr:hypothetical protein [Candidatus Prometheoarchaeum syntrophicum]